MEFLTAKYYTVYQTEGESLPHTSDSFLLNMSMHCQILCAFLFASFYCILVFLYSTCDGIGVLYLIKVSNFNGKTTTAPGNWGPGLKTK